MLPILDAEKWGTQKSKRDGNFILNSPQNYSQPYIGIVGKFPELFQHKSSAEGLGSRYARSVSIRMARTHYLSVHQVVSEYLVKSHGSGKWDKEGIGHPTSRCCGSGWYLSNLMLHYSRFQYGA